MPVESWTDPQETPALAATAAAMIDAALTGSGLSRDAYWAAVRKGYNTPYNDPQPHDRPAEPKSLTEPKSPAEPKSPTQASIAVVLTGSEATPPLPIAAMVPQASVELHAG